VASLASAEAFREPEPLFFMERSSKVRESTEGSRGFTLYRIIVHSSLDPSGFRKSIRGITSGNTIEVLRPGVFGSSEWRPFHR
jgi:hypothetical protein